MSLMIALCLNTILLFYPIFLHSYHCSLRPPIFFFSYINSLQPSIFLLFYHYSLITSLSLLPLFLLSLKGWHCEGSVLRTLFGLLMWDQIFTDMSDVFLTPYQDAPLDLCFPSFIRSRYVHPFMVLIIFESANLIIKISSCLIGPDRKSVV